MHAMADFGPTTVTNNTDFNYNAPPFLMKQDAICSQSEGTKTNITTKSPDYNGDREGNTSADIFNNQADRLDDSKDSDEGFSSSFSPTSEPQMLPDQTSTLWGNNNNREEFFLPGFSMSAANVASPLLHNSAIAPINVNTGFGGGNSRRVVQAPSPLGHIRKPTPALSNYLASNKAMANALGVSGWPSNQSQASSWPTSQPPIGSNNFQTQNWNGTNRASGNMPHLTIQASIPPHQQNGGQYITNKSNSFPPPQDQFQNNMMSAASTIQAKNLKNSRSFNASPISNNMGTMGNMMSKSSSPFSTSATSSGSSINSGLEMSNTIVDDITQLTNSFSNLNTNHQHQQQGNGVQNHSNSNGMFSNHGQVNYDMNFSHK